MEYLSVFCNMCSKFGFKITILFLLVSTRVIAQSYNFTNYSLEEGLPQSQVTCIYQAKDRTLWLGTFGGVSNFDGKEFMSYSKADGLISNSVTSIVEDDRGQIILGTEAGLNVLRGGRIKTISYGRKISGLKKDKNGIIWGLSEHNLFKLVNNQQVFLSLDEGNITALNSDKNGDLFAVVKEIGIYKLVDNIWVLYKKFEDNLRPEYVVKIIFDRTDPDKIYLLTVRNGAFVSEGDGFKHFFSQKGVEIYYSIEEDSKGHIWIGTEKGAYSISKNNTVLHFNSENGLTDNRISEIFRDAENNIWISSFSDGIFKYEGDDFIRYDKFKGQNLAFPVSAMAEDQYQNLWIGTFNKGLLKYNGKNFEPVNQPALRDRNIYFVYRDQKNNIWTSAQNYGVWKYDGQTFKHIPQTEKLNFSSMLIDDSGGVLLNSTMASLYIKDGKTEKISGFDGYSSCVYALNRDSILLGTSNGIYLINNKKLDLKFRIKELNGVFILSIIKHGDHLVIATLGDGMFTWNIKTKEVKKYVITNGLNSNDIYSLAVDNADHLWVGTGRGINKLKYNNRTKEYTAFSNSLLVVECNQNAILNYKNNILVGTIRGIVLCKINPKSDQNQKPVIHIQSVNIYHKSNRDKDTTIMLAGGPIKQQVLSHSQNHIAINFKGVFLTNPSAVTYRYKLVGVDADFGAAVDYTEVEYSALRPGSYTFQVYAIAGGQRSNLEEFNFIVVPPYYDTTWFKAFAFFVLIGLIWVIFYVFFKSRERKKYQFEKIKQQEQEKIRKQTSEDFHDDIGNKLTRINVLSEILDKKVTEDQKDQKELIRLIKENAALLYTGTKDILWALDPKSDNLLEILVHIKNFGIDLFQNTGVQFKVEGILSEYQKINLSMEFNRNLTLVFKEMLNNILKHAQAKTVLLMVIKTEHNTIDILTTDDGIGFDLESIEKGRGLNNIQTRCKRIKSVFKISSAEGRGTTTTISTKISVTN